MNSIKLILLIITFAIFFSTFIAIILWIFLSKNNPDKDTSNEYYFNNLNDDLFENTSTTMTDIRTPKGMAYQRDIIKSMSSFEKGVHKEI